MYCGPDLNNLTYLIIKLKENLAKQNVPSKYISTHYDKCTLAISMHTQGGVKMQQIESLRCWLCNDALKRLGVSLAIQPMQCYDTLRSNNI